MKLKDWADKQGIAYLTAWRWFKTEDPRLAGAYQSKSGTIIVPDENESLEQIMANNQNHGDAMSVFLKKTVEFSKNNSTVEDFAAYIISNFSIKLNSASPDSPKYSRQKPKPEEVQKHFQQFLPNKQTEEHLKSVRNSIIQTGQINKSLSIDEFNDLENIFINLDETANELEKQNVDLNTTPQSSINFTESTIQPVSVSSLFLNDQEIIPMTFSSVSSFQPTQKEFQSANKVIEAVEIEDRACLVEKLPRKRGRKAIKNKE